MPLGREARGWRVELHSGETCPYFCFFFFSFYRLRIVQVMLSSSMSHVASKFCFTFGLKVRPLHGAEGGPRVCQRTI